MQGTATITDSAQHTSIHETGNTGGATPTRRLTDVADDKSRRRRQRRAPPQSLTRASTPASTKLHTSIHETGNTGGATHTPTHGRHASIRHDTAAELSRSPAGFTFLLERHDGEARRRAMRRGRVCRGRRFSYQMIWSSILYSVEVNCAVSQKDTVQKETKPPTEPGNTHTEDHTLESNHTHE